MCSWQKGCASDSTKALSKFASIVKVTWLSFQQTIFCKSERSRLSSPLLWARSEKRQTEICVRSSLCAGVAFFVFSLQRCCAKARSVACDLGMQTSSYRACCWLTQCSVRSSKSLVPGQGQSELLSRHTEPGLCWQESLSGESKLQLECLLRRSPFWS